ncbi:MAG: hypothetical protein AAFO62_10020, partial [Pseudomonadota bacterium]
MNAVSAEQGMDIMPAVDDLYDACVQMLLREGYQPGELLVLLAGANGDIARHAWKHDAPDDADPLTPAATHEMIGLITNRPDNLWDNLEAMAQTAASDSSLALYPEDMVDHREAEGRHAPITGLSFESDVTYDLTRWLLPRLNVLRAKIKRTFVAYDLDRDALIDAAGLAALRAVVTLPEKQRLAGALAAAEAIVAVAMAPDITLNATDARSEPAEEPAPADAPALPPTIARIKTEPAALPRTSGTDLRRAMFGANADDANAEDDFAADENDAFEDDIAEDTAARGKGAIAAPSAQAQTAMGAFQRL